MDRCNRYRHLTLSMRFNFLERWEFIANFRNRFDPLFYPPDLKIDFLFIARYRQHLSPLFSSGPLIIRNKMVTKVYNEMYGLINVIVNTVTNFWVHLQNLLRSLPLEEGTVNPNWKFHWFKLLDGLLNLSIINLWPRIVCLAEAEPNLLRSFLKEGIIFCKQGNSRGNSKQFRTCYKSATKTEEIT